MLAGAAVLCFFRWQVWFGNPAEPLFTGDTLSYRLPCFGDDTVPGFVRTNQGWQDTKQSDVLRFILFGDVHNQLDSTDYAAILLRHDTVDGYAQLGDWMERGYFYYRQQLLGQLQGTGFDTLPVINCPGNHEYRKGVVRRLPEMWTDMFRHPMNGPARFLGTTYYIDFPNLRFIVIDTNGLQRLSDYTIVNTWVKSVLASAGNRFTVVMMHHPVFSDSMGRQSVPIYLTFRGALSKADLVFAGHDHNYARRLPFIDTNSARKFYLHKLSPRFDRVGSGTPMYQEIEVMQDILTLRTWYVDTCAVYDEVVLVGSHRGDAKPMSFVHWSGKEQIGMPDKYTNRNDLKVRRFIHRRAYRLRQDSLNHIEAFQPVPLVQDSTPVAQ